MLSRDDSVRDRVEKKADKILKNSTMEKENKNRIVCMNCLTSKIVNKQEGDPEKTRLIITWSCDKCCEEDDDVQFYDYQMRELNKEYNDQ